MRGRCTKIVDIENAVFTKVKSALTKQFPNITVESVTTYSPSKFPFVCIEETDNYMFLQSVDSSGRENHATVVYEVNAYSNKASKKKSECKAIIAAVDDTMRRLGFARTAKVPINSGDATTYRIFARYTTMVSRTNTTFISGGQKR